MPEDREMIANEVDKAGAIVNPKNDSHHKAADRSVIIAAMIQALGPVIAAVLTVILVQSRVSKPTIEPTIFLTSDKPSVGSEIEFKVAGIGSLNPFVEIVELQTDEPVTELNLSNDGNGYIWTPERPGTYLARLTLLDEVDGSQVRGVEPATKEFTVDAQQQAPPEIISQVFNRRIGNDGSCTETNVRQTYELCLVEGSRITSFDERENSARNGSGSVTLIEEKPNCVSLYLQYSDSGRSILGDCRGNGWVDYTVTLNGTVDD